MKRTNIKTKAIWRKMALFTLIALSLILSAAPHATASDIYTLKQTIEVEGDVVTLGDIFPNARRHRHEALFKSPPLGHAGNISITHLIDTAERLGFTFETPTNLGAIRVARPARIIKPATFEAALKAQLAKQLNKTADQTLNITYNKEPTQQMVPLNFNGAVKLQHFTFNKARKTFRATFVPKTGELNQETASAFRRTLTGKATISLNRPVLIKAIKRGEKFTNDHIQVKAFNPYRVPKNTLASKADIIGQVATRNMKNGAFITTQSLEQEKVVRKNQLVTIIFNMRGLNLKTQGKAMDDGGLNQTVAVMNILSKRIVHGTIKSAGIVEINSTPHQTFKKTAHLNNTAH